MKYLSDDGQEYETEEEAKAADEAFGERESIIEKMVEYCKEAGLELRLAKRLADAAMYLVHNSPPAMIVKRRKTSNGASEEWEGSSE